MAKDTCTFRYNYTHKSMGRVGVFACKSVNSFHGDLINHVVDKYNYCPFCGKEIILIETKDK